jgi:hypothetical protein
LGLAWSSQQGLTIGVANGERASCLGICPQAGITIDNEQFLIDFYVIALEGYELVLGCNWLRQLGPILWDFDKLTMAFCWMNRRVKFQGLAAPNKPLLAATATDNLLNLLLAEYRDIFSKPEGLPPARRFDHRIHLLSETTPVAVRPYRYPLLLKDEIEKQCDDMLQQGLIRPSTSAFSSPVLFLVCKKDMTWRFCVDFRALNAVTLKDKFPIPVVDELLDELQNTRFFSKIDLRSWYHQVLMHEDDIAKTVFRTHQSHFEFLVMPFGLTNAPATFQALMNETLKPYILKSVLVFFDDILIYNATWADHLQHLRMVLDTLRQCHLFAKESKCVLGAKEISYLGHVISRQGVAMDITKVEAVQSWPQPKTVCGLRGFLGLAGYYRRFIANFGVIALRLTQLLKKEGFTWTTTTTEAFDALKKALTTAPVL